MIFAKITLLLASSKLSIGMQKWNVELVNVSAYRLVLQVPMYLTSSLQMILIMWFDQVTKLESVDLFQQ